MGKLPHQRSHAASVGLRCVMEVFPFAKTSTYLLDGPLLEFVAMASGTTAGAALRSDEWHPKTD